MTKLVNSICSTFFYVVNFGSPLSLLVKTLIIKGNRWKKNYRRPWQMLNLDNVINDCNHDILVITQLGFTVYGNTLRQNAWILHEEVQPSSENVGPINRDAIRHTVSFSFFSYPQSKLVLTLGSSSPIHFTLQHQSDVIGVQEKRDQCKCWVSIHRGGLSHYTLPRIPTTYQ